MRMFLQYDILDFVKKTASDGYGWMGLPSPQAGSGEQWRLAALKSTSLFGRIVPGHLFDSGLAANRSLSLAQNYVLALLITPFDVVETLRELQFQPRLEVIREETSVRKYGWFGEKGDRHIPLLQRGTWESIREIVESPNGGITVLIRGHFTKLIYRSVYDVIQGYLEETLNDVFNVYKQTDISTLFLSSLVASFFLYPLDAIKTCLVLQSASSSKKHYQGPVHMLYSAMRSDSKNILKIYHPQICWLPVAVNALGPLLHQLAGMVISRLFRLNSRSDGFLYYIARVGFLALESAILSPLLLIKKRLEIQTLLKFSPADNPEPRRTHDALRDKSRALELFDFHPSVRIYPERYTGALDCLTKTIALEGTDPPSPLYPRSLSMRYNMSRYKKSSGFSSPYAPSSEEPAAPEPKTPKAISISGIKSVFRGFWCLYLNKVIMFSLEEINKKPGPFPWLGM